MAMLFMQQNKVDGKTSNGASALESLLKSTQQQTAQQTQQQPQRPKMEENFLHQLLIAQLSSAASKQAPIPTTQSNSGMNSTISCVPAATEPLIRAVEQQQQQQQELRLKREAAAVAGNSSKNSSPSRSASPDASGWAPTDEQKLKRRREQIAAASRKSRAKRKREMQDLQMVNQQLKDKIARLEQQLGHEGRDIHSDDDVRSTLSRKHSDGTDDGSQCGGQRQRAGSSCTSSSAEESDSERLSRLLDEHPDLKPVVDMVQERVNWLFEKTVEDAKTVHGQRLKPEALSLVNKLTMRLCLP